jgi:hypothetical protein
MFKCSLINLIFVGQSMPIPHHDGSHSTNQLPESSSGGTSGGATSGGGGGGGRRRRKKARKKAAEEKAEESKSCMLYCKEDFRTFAFKLMKQVSVCSNVESREEQEFK